MVKNPLATSTFFKAVLGLPVRFEHNDSIELDTGAIPLVIKVKSRFKDYKIPVNRILN